jgi:deazaflavin-dependent oxidoreductase (nitroreductase family)
MCDKEIRLPFDPQLATEKYCYLTTTGRVTGKEHTIEVWLTLLGSTLYILNGPVRSKWVKNVMHNPRVTIRIRDTLVGALARVVDDIDEAARARRMTSAKYGAEAPEEWTRNALVVSFSVD